ncbi:MAG TPA: CHAT domain-containing protein [Trebonia sp.]|jgi:tetratricopeptide (TPR) repeat protein|nr:CHAT domain-containing protein [Trebonia sp.]
MDTSPTANLLALALSRPNDALSQAQELLSGELPPAEASIARQAAGIALRDTGRIGPARAQLRLALRLAREARDAQRVADAQATLGLTMVVAGGTGRGLAHLNEAAALARDALAGQVLMRRAAALALIGRRDEALRDLNQVVAIVPRYGDRLWEARARSHRGLLLLERGLTRRANDDFTAAEGLFAELGQEWEHAAAQHNRGLVAAASGRVPEALVVLARAGQQYGRLGTPTPDLAIDRCAVLLSAGLAADALAGADAAIAAGDTSGEPGAATSTKFAELLYAAAAAALAAGDPAGATERARRAAGLFARQRRRRWSARTRLVLVQARHAAGDGSLAAYRLACSVARELAALGAEESPEAHLLAGRLALLRGNGVAARRHLADAARRRAGPAVTQSRAWLARALLAQARGQQRQMLAACRHGLAVVAGCQQLLGASEMRAAVTAYGGELATLGQRAAIGAGDARRLLAWSERWRATIAAATPPAIARDEQLAQDMSALREVSRRLDQEPDSPARAAELRRDRLRLERAVRDHVLRTPGAAGAAAPPFSLAALTRALGGGVLVELVEVDQVLHAVTVSRSGVRLHVAGASAVAAEELDYARLQLKRLASGRPGRDPAGTLESAGALLQEALLGPAVADLGDGDVIMVPSGRLHAIPWGLLPALRERAVSVSPSATAWLRARSAPPPGRRLVTLVQGPGLPAAPAEIEALAGLYPQATVLGGKSPDGEPRLPAAAGPVLAGLDGAWLAHVAAHGRFRADNPLFSNLVLEDGELTLYELEGISRAPYRLVLSACDTGLGAAVGADELLGIASSLMPRGTAGIVAAIVGVNDAATGPVMRSLHAAMAGGAGLGQALRAAREAAAGDPLALATACAFVALGC